MGLRLCPSPTPHWLPCPAPLQRSKDRAGGQGQAAAGHTKGRSTQEGLQGLGSVPAPYWQAPWPPEGLPAHSPSCTAAASPGSGGLSRGPRVFWTQCPLAQGSDIGKEGTLAPAVVPQGARNQEHLRNCRPHQNSKQVGKGGGGLSQGRAGNSAVPLPRKCLIVTYESTLLTSVADRCVYTKNWINGWVPGVGPAVGGEGLVTCRGGID